MNRLVLVAVALLGTALRAGAQDPPPIQDNSFLIEEAYNQEPGVVQHISTLSLDRGGDSWEFGFTQEWPVFSQRHQLSFTLPVQKGGAGGSTGIGDLALHYRYQVPTGERSGLALAPRLSLIVPTGDETQKRGAGGAGMQVNLPASLALSARVVTHGNVGATYTPSARNALGQQGATVEYNAGGSVIWLAHPVLNLMLEGLWESDQEVEGPGILARRYGLYVAPGVRAAINFDSGLQLVPGIAVPVGLGPASGERTVLLYLSIEHPFVRQSR